MKEIEELIATIVKSDDESLHNMSMNKVADFYRNGSSLETLLPLLECDRASVIQCGAWIASEVVTNHRGRQLFDQLSRLLSHPDDEVRYLVIEGVSLLIRHTDSSALVRLVDLLADPSGPVRRTALRWLCLIPDSEIKGLKGTRYEQESCMLYEDMPLNKVLQGVMSENIVVRRLAIAATLRKHGDNIESVDSIYPHLDEEEKRLISSLPRCFRY